MCFSPVEAVVPDVPPECSGGHVAAVCWSADAVTIRRVVDVVTERDVMGVFRLDDR